MFHEPNILNSLKPFIFIQRATDLRLQTDIFQQKIKFVAVCGRFCAVRSKNMLFALIHIFLFLQINQKLILK